MIDDNNHSTVLKDCVKSKCQLLFSSLLMHVTIVRTFLIILRHYVYVNKRPRTMEYDCDFS